MPYTPQPLALLGASPGPFEIMILFAAILLLFGANRLPELFRTMGRFSAELKKASDDFKNQLMDVPNEITATKNEIEQDLKDLTVSRPPTNYDLTNNEPPEETNTQTDGPSDA